MTTMVGFPGDVSVKEPVCQYRRHKRHGFNPWVRKIPWRRVWQPTPVFLSWRMPWTKEPGKLQSTGLQSRTWTEATSHTHTQRLYNEKSEVLANKQTKRVKYEASK